MRMMAGSSVVGLFFAAGVSLLAACERQEAVPGNEEMPEDTPPVEPSVSIASAVDSIVQARCEREARCNNIGPEQEYATTETCLTRIRADWRDELNFAECAGGVDSKELNECLQEIRNDDCNNPFDTLGRLAACRSSDICLATP